jgi:hypothetical protein
MEIQKAGSFDTAFANKVIRIANQETNNPLVGKTKMNQDIKEDELIPGDFIWFRNLRKNSGDQILNSGFQVENAVYIGKGQFCAAFMKEPVTSKQMREILLGHYNLGFKTTFKLGDLAAPNVVVPNDLPVQYLRQINRNFRIR